MDAELIAIHDSLDYFMYDYHLPIPPNLRILTDSYEALQELCHPRSTHPSVHHIIHQITALQTSGCQVRIDWTPGHEPAAPGNQAAHVAAQEALLTIASDGPPAPPFSDHPWPNCPDDDPTLAPAIRLRKFRQLKQQRLKALTPSGHLTSFPTLTRAQEIFLNKFLTNTCTAPETIRQWYYPQHAPRCPYCHHSIAADLHHLIWHCPKFSRFRTFTPPHHDTSTYIDPTSLSHDTLLEIIIYATKSGLVRAI